MHNYTGRAKKVKTKNVCLFCYFPECNSNKITEIFPFSSLDAAAHSIFGAKQQAKGRRIGEFQSSYSKYDLTY